MIAIKAAIYARTTKIDASTAPQIEFCREYIQEEKGTVVAIFDDPGVSADQYVRDGLDHLMENVHLFDTLVVTSLDRLYRSEDLTAKFIAKLLDSNISLVVVKDLSI